MNSLKKTFALFLILVIILPGETAHAFSFVPEFISHYKHHNEAHHPISFIDFVGEHFGVGNHKESKHHKQDECPANHNHALVSLTFVIEKKAAFEVFTEVNTCFPERTPVPPYQFTYSEFHATIWQPPKIG